tara:strand:- start:3138 stop:3344 length:207 start_codon:yes stop_codon:yes gene_type:complete
MTINKTYRIKELTAEQIEIKKQYYRDYYQKRKKEQGINITDRRGHKSKPPSTPIKFYNVEEEYIVSFD